jgi:hypothetical protein
MEKLKEVLIGIGGFLLIVLYWIVSAAFSFAILYFVVTFIVNMNKPSYDDIPKTDVQMEARPKTDPKESLRTVYMNGCLADATAESRGYCSCTFDKLYVAIGPDAMLKLGNDYNKNGSSAILEDKKVMDIITACAITYLK